MIQNWHYLGKLIEEVPKEAFGFLYVIEADNKFYFGKKQLNFSKKVKLSKKARLNSENKRKRIDYKVSESDWRDYLGSCKPLLEWIENNPDKPVYRNILSFHPTKIDLTYREIELLMNKQVLFRDDCWNSNIASKFFKGRITKI